MSPKKPGASLASTAKSTGFKATAVGAAVALTVTGAVLYPGFETADVDLNDGGVWVVNKSIGKIGHVNYQSKVLDGGLVTPLSNFDLAQDGDRVLVRNLEQASVTTIDPAMVQFAGDNNLPANSSFSFGGEVVAVTDDERGVVRAATTARLSEFASQDADPLLESEGDVGAVVSVTDVVWTVDYETGELASFTFDDEGVAQPGEQHTIPELSGLAEPQLTTVGDAAVVFDAPTGSVYTSEGGEAVVENSANARVQAPGPENDGVAVATANTLATVGLDGRDIDYKQLETAGTPVEPVRVGTCTYAAWQTSGEYLRDCDDDAQDQSTLIPDMVEGAELVFRVNRDVVVLNDIANGQVWLPNEGMEIVSNWSDLEPPAGEGESTEEETKEITDAIELPNRTEENQEPLAEPDRFSVRPGRTTVLPVLYNDVDPDGDLLTASLEGEPPAVGDLQPIHDGTGYQIVVPEDATGTATFAYRADDGRGGTDVAQVTLSVVDEETNEPPKQERVTTLRVKQGESVTQNVLTDWSDPEGDHLQLLGGTSDGDDIIRVRPDGTMSFQDDGKRVGQKEVTLQVSDGEESTQGRVLIEVLAESTVPPITATDHVVTEVGQQATFAPLDNDRDPTGEGLRLAAVDEVQGLEISTNSETGAVTVSGERAGTYYAKYVATNGPASAPGLVRIDLQEPAENPEPPVAVRDVALLPAGQDVLVNVLGNDTDPAGGVLVVTGVEAQDEAPFSVSIERNAFVRITDVRGTTAPATVHYTVSNGSQEATGEITVTPIPAPPHLDPPQANGDTAVVRAGDVVTVNVLENDVHPNGAELTLLPELSETDDLGEGSLISVADDSVRFRAGDFGGKSRQVSAVYTIAGPDGQEASAQVTFNVQPAADASSLANNEPPNAAPVMGRVFAGSSTNVLIPIDGIDPDGDSVSLVQFGESPSLGTAKIRGNSIDYTAHENATGTDEFTYVVEDRLGARSTGTIKIGVAPLAETNNAPVAINDFITVRPDRPVAVDVMNNDTDPDGDAIALMSEVESATSTDAEVIDGRVALTSRPDEGTTSVRYSVTDGRGGTSSATLTVQSDPEAKLLAPIARDDSVGLEEVIGEEEVQVDILRNDEDPDGRADQLEIGLPDDPDSARVTEEGLSVRVLEDAQVIAYTVTDPDGLSSTAFVYVPGVGAARPILRTDLNLEVKAGEALPLNLEDLVLVRDGRSPRLTTDDKVSSAPASDGTLVQSATELTFTPPADFSGPGSVTFEVTDGSGPDDPEGLTSVLTAPVNVLPAEGPADPDSENPETESDEEEPEEETEQPDPENFPPTLQANSLNVGQGEDPTRLDLRLAANDQNEEDVPNLLFAVESVDIAGVQAEILDGHVLSVSAPANTERGTRGSITVSVTDGVNAPVTGTMSVTVTGSTRELAVAVADRVENAHQGRTEVVDVLANDHNPYEGEGDLRLISARVTGGSAIATTDFQGATHQAGSAEVRGDQVAITPNDGFVGTMRVQYTIGDVTEDPQRNVSGTVTLNVKGAPAAPGVPRIESVGDQQVVLTWDAPANNGEEITHYTVSGGGHSQQCATTTCTIRPLTNNQTYNFTVTATNAVGESPASAASADARPDVEPERPAAPTASSGDQQISVNWTAPISRGSPIRSYTLEISPAPPGGVPQVTGVTGTSYVFKGLNNGTAYQVRVRAVNDAERPSEWSSYSASTVPAGKPFKPGAPTASRADSAVDGGVVNVAWKAPGANGAAIQHYRLRIISGGSIVRTIEDIPSNQLRQTVTGLSTNKSYSFAVEAQNRVGWSDRSAASSAVTPYGRPKAVQSVTAKPTKQDRQMQLNFSPPAANGSNITGYQYSTDGGGWKSFGGPGAVIDVGSNGDPHTWRVRALNAAGAGQPSPPSNNTSAYGPLRDNANISKSHGDHWVEFRWNPKAGQDNGRSVKYNVTVGGNSTANDGVERVNNLEYSTSRTIRIVATDAEGQRESWEATAKTNPKPARKVSLSRGNLNNSYEGCPTNCYTFQVNIENFEPGTYRVDCYNQNGKFNNYPHTMSAGNDGRGSKNVQCVNQAGYAMPVYVIVDGTRSNDARW
ncbi:Ig-like domain-containing protein [Zhihengliuella alba]|uniref:Ig-like domain-containing protein n=1 Tax=Zhihengliuella alba TaxID=547018 RepID=UPI0031EAAF07